MTTHKACKKAGQKGRVNAVGLRLQSSSFLEDKKLSRKRKKKIMMMTTTTLCDL